MGSALRLTIWPGVGEAVDQTAAEAWSDVVDEFEQSEQQLSRFRDTSDLTELNRAAGTGRTVDIGRRLERAIAAADRARRLTDDRFDPRVLADLDRLGYRGAALPAAGEVVAAVVRRRGPTGLGRVGWRVAPGRWRVERPLDLGGIGKGLALRWAAARLRRRGIRSFLLEAGGDLVAGGRGPDDGWRIGIEDPAGAEAPIAVVAIDDLAVATSSIAVHAWVVDGRPVHHLLDPATGQPGGEGLLAATVAGRDPAWAEVWSKSLFLAGAAGIADAARGRGLAAWWLRADGSLEMTPAARELTVWEAAEARRAPGRAGRLVR